MATYMSLFFKKKFLCYRDVNTRENLLTSKLVLVVIGTMEGSVGPSNTRVDDKAILNILRIM